MNKNLVLVESPSKAKTINKYLGKDYIVEPTIGHVRNLPKTKLGVDIENNYEPQYLNIRGKGDIIKKIKNLATKSKKIYIATDPDREGEAIAQDIVDILNGKINSQIYRVLFNEITKTGVQKAMKEPRGIDNNLVSSQRARRVMDRIIGYQISPFLWKTVIETAGTASLSAGRVQSVALKLICERESEIEIFQSIEYWSIWAIFKTDKGEEFKAKLFAIEGKDIKLRLKPEASEEQIKEFFEHYISISNEKTAREIFDRISLIKEFRISNVSRRNTKRNSPPPFITSSLQSEASRRLRLRPSQTMMIAQKLYEGIDLGKEGIQGLITYMRTDSTRINDEIADLTKDFIINTFGKAYYPLERNSFEKKKTINVQDAHEAIRPTSLNFTPEKVKPFLDNRSYKLYELIWNRYLASQMSQAILQATVVEIKAKDFLFRAAGSVITFSGFLQVYEDLEENNRSDDKDEYRNEKIPIGLEKDQRLNLNQLQKTQHFTKPPARYTESTLIKALESNGIGRPSTYSLIVGTIQDRKYVDMVDRKLMPTTLGERVNGVLVKNFPDIINVDFTAGMENELDQIARGENEYVTVLNDFYIPFSRALKQVEDKIEKIICDVCGGIMEIRAGRFGKYLACTNYPECKNIKSFKDYFQLHQEPEYTGDKCEKCGSRTVFREGKFGRFIGCEKYPECDFVKPITLGITCPKCNKGEIVERKSKRNKLFYGCSTFPNCDFISWYKPADVSCPNKDSDYMEERYSSKKGNYLKCPVCKEEMNVELVEEE